MTVKVFLFYFSTWLFCYLFVTRSAFVNNMMSDFGLYLRKKAFPSSSSFEFNKFAVLRFAFGVVLIIRGINVETYLLSSEYLSPIGLWNFGELLAGMFITFGFLTQWAFAFLMLAMWHIGDQAIGKATLGNDIAAMLCLLLVLVNSGKYLSIDALLIKRYPKMSAALFYYKGDPNPSQTALSKFLALTGYWSLCVYSLMMHLNEPAWMTGVAGPLLLTNNFMSKYYNYFIVLFSSSDTAVVLSKISLWVMMLWYPTILPFTLVGGYFREYIIIWGVLFFTLSLFFLNLGSLAEIEFILWAGLFWTTLGQNQKQSILVFYDDTCNLCDKTIQFITFVDIFNLIKLKPLSKNIDTAAGYGIHYDQAMQDLYGVLEHNGQNKSGYDFYVLLSKTLVVLWPLYPLLMLGKLFNLGPSLYALIAKRRQALFGYCELPRKKYERSSNLTNQGSRVVNTFAVHVLFLAGAYLVAIPLPYMGWDGKQTLGSLAAHIYGIAPINVFNSTDLRMAENWFVLENDEFQEMVPLLTKEGARLAMHKSDRLYFGNTLRIRRDVIGKDGCQFETYQDKIEYLSQVYLHQKNVPSGTYHFTYEQYHQPLPNNEMLLQNQFSVNSVLTQCNTSFSIAYSK